MSVALPAHRPCSRQTKPRERSAIPLTQVEIVREVRDPRIVERIFQPGDVELGEMHVLLQPFACFGSRGQRPRLRDPAVAADAAP